MPSGSSPSSCESQTRLQRRAVMKNPMQTTSFKESNV
jgi:hypothetical protein